MLIPRPRSGRGPARPGCGARPAERAGGRAWGKAVGRALPNGDFTLGHDAPLAGDLDRIRRVRPVRAA
ncbi:hypothetical protein GCM10009654_25050 [Streptomyces hebeiensis]|uniref:Uncharacterized protein n=1 Tax=Streptomyces hebeiensis TaxID=229486 RepID=A0ABN1UTG9_9ACTN